MPENTVSVTRPGKWGNPFRVEDKVEKVMKMLSANGKYPVEHLRKQVTDKAQEQAVNQFRSMMLDLNSIPVGPETYARFRYMRDRIRDLEGKNLACFCSLGSPCHADVLLELANP